MRAAEAKNLEAISKAIDQHNTACEWPAVAVEMNPFEVDRLGWDSIRGLRSGRTRTSARAPSASSAPARTGVPGGGGGRSRRWPNQTVPVTPVTTG